MLFFGCSDSRLVFLEKERLFFFLSWWPYSKFFWL